MDESTVRLVSGGETDPVTNPDQAPDESGEGLLDIQQGGDAEDYRQRGVAYVKGALAMGLNHLEEATTWADQVQAVPEALRQRVKELAVECRRAVKEAGETL